MRCLTALFIVFTLFSTQLVAQESIELELTPLFGYRFGGEFDDEQSNSTIELEDGNSYGLLTSWAYDQSRQGELLVSHYDSAFSSELTNNVFNPSDIGITYIHLGGNIQLSDNNLPFYLSGGIGITHLSPENNGLKSETKFSGSLGLNTRVALTESVRLYIGGRVYATLLDADSEIFCDSQNCAIYVESEVWVQSELSAGLTFKF
ncbi:hypothetical protein [Thalassotalea atypica]|uniref:hypothetical protein n=1 Tax=Thalassotalea atypica TaxID=2054316 RepID=UPI0025737B40|nr:hypothetical protein [Thalassotalea atypica]